MKKIFNKVSLMLSLIFVVSLTLVGCAPKGNPEETLNTYYESIKDGDAEGAYQTLCEQSKKNFTEEDFKKWVETKKEIDALISFKNEKNKEDKTKKLDGIEFKNAVEFKVTEKIKSFYENKDNTTTYKRYVVNDNGKWKIYRGKENGKEILAKSLNNLAQMYVDGKGKTKDSNQAASIVNEALKYDKKSPYLKYSLTYVYVDLGRYDEAIKPINEYLEQTKDNKDKSNGYNILGVIYQNKQDFSKAKEYFNQALKLDSTNQYAKTNLENINRIGQILN